MTPSEIPLATELVSGNLPGLIIAVGTLVASIASVIAAWRGGRVLEVSNGHAAAQAAEIKRLEERLLESFTDRVAAAVLAKQAAEDVRSALKKTPKNGD